MDLMNDIMGNVEDSLLGPLIPQKHVSAAAFTEFLKRLKTHLEHRQELLDLNSDDAEGYVISEIQRIKNELIAFIDYIVDSYDLNEVSNPYHELKAALIREDIDSFLKLIRSLLASVSYPIDMKHEGYLHSNIHLLLSVLGFDIVSEEATNIGRIDAVIRFSRLVYIMEFKRGSCEDAMDQIKKKEYHEKFIVSGKRVIGVGVGFAADNKNIGSHRSEVLVA